MEILLSIALFVSGLLLLILGADWLIQSSVKISVLFKLAPLFIGMVLVAFGTSAPEAGVGIIAALRNQKGIALGNIIGSNIANIGLVLGVCALFKPLNIDKSIFKREIPIMFSSVILFYVLSLDLLISRIDGLIFILAFVIFCFISYKGAKQSFDRNDVQNFEFKKRLVKLNSPLPIFLIVLFSLCGVIAGADLMVRGGSSLAKIFGINPWIIGITIFAIGTSLPELVASLTASFKKASSISVGNIVGSNIFNILFVLGIVALIRPISIKGLSILSFELPVLFFFSFFLFIFMRTGYRVSRKEGLALFFGYISFLVILVARCKTYTN